MKKNEKKKMQNFYRKFKNSAVNLSTIFREFFEEVFIKCLRIFIEQFNNDFLRELFRRFLREFPR